MDIRDIEDGLMQAHERARQRLGEFLERWNMPHVQMMAGMLRASVPDPMWEELRGRHPQAVDELEQMIGGKKWR